MNKFEYKNLTPFKWFVLENFPFIEADFDALTEWQLFCKLGREINKIIDSTNVLGTQVESLTDYVKNYFDNLDVQDEINNKLNEMTESGQLQEIIEHYLKLAGLLCYNTVNDMKNSTNVINGSFAKTFGKNSFNDGLGRFYKIRNITNNDVVDNVNIIPIASNPNLVAELIKENRKKYIFIGDSYGQGYSPDGATTSWIQLIINKLNLQQNDYIVKSYGGTGFVNTVDGKNFITMLNEISADENITDIICCGGYNDQFNYNNIEDGITNFCTIAKNKFPNAKVHIGEIGWATDATKFLSLSLVISHYINGCVMNNVHYLNNVEFIMHIYDTLFASDGFHPNQNGQNELAKYILQAVENGSCQIIRSYVNIEFEASNGITENWHRQMGVQQSNQLITFSGQNDANITLQTSINFSGRSGARIEIGTIKTGYLKGNIYAINNATVNVILDCAPNYYRTTARVEVLNGKLFLNIPGIINSTHNDYVSDKLSLIQILGGFTMICDATLC